MLPAVLCRSEGTCCNCSSEPQGGGSASGFVGTLNAHKFFLFCFVGKNCVKLSEWKPDCWAAIIKLAEGIPYNMFN